MGKGRFFFTALAVLAALSLAGVAGCRGRGGSPAATASTGEPPVELRAFLPSAEEAGPWEQDGDILDIAGEDLYLHIDGGAAIYQEYGFLRVLIQDYRKTGGKRLSLEIFEMASPEAAYGMFTFKRSAKGEAIRAGSGGELEEYYLNFWKGRFLVTITGSDQDEQARRELLQMARAVEGRIPGGLSRTPPLVAMLPEARLIRTSVRYFRGYLGFMNFYPSLGAEEYRVREGVKGDYASGAAVFILQYSSDEEARARLATVADAFRSDPNLRDFETANGLARMVDARGKKVTLRAVTGYILIGVEDAAGDEASGLLESIVATLR